MKTLTWICVGVLMAISPVNAQDGHDHSQSQLQLSLNQGKKWTTDVPLRSGFSAIRKLMQTNLSKIHDDKMPADDYKKLSVSITKELNGIFSKCKLEPKADAMLHVILVKVIEGAKDMKEGPASSDRQQGAIKIVGALSNYGEYFDHPGWKNLTH